MSFDKVILIGEKGQLHIKESAGVASILFSYSVDGARAVVNADIELSAVQLEMIAAEYLKAKYPAMSGVIDGVFKVVESVTSTL